MPIYENKFLLLTWVFVGISFGVFKLYGRNKSLRFPYSATILLPGFYVANIASYFIDQDPRVFGYGYPFIFFDSGGFVAFGFRWWVVFIDIFLVLVAGYILGRIIEARTTPRISFLDFVSELKWVKFSFGISIALDAGLTYFILDRNYFFFENIGNSVLEKFGNSLFNLCIWGLFWGLNTFILKALQFDQDEAFATPIKGFISGLMIGGVNGFIAGWFSGMIFIDYFGIPNWSLICSSFATISTAFLGWVLGSILQRTSFSNP